jgi:ABC-type nickel/cobalt efflux system permease component RcnA
VVISSYLLTHRSQMRRGILLALLSSLVQALSAIAMVGVLAILLDVPRLETTARVRELEIVSYGLIVAIGLWMLVSAVRERPCCDHASHYPDPKHSGHSRSEEEHTREPRASLRQLAAVILAVGIRPCSGAIILLLFTLSQAMLAVGIAAVLTMALGTALTVSALALFTVLSRKTVVGMVGATAGENRVQKGFSIAGSLAIVLFGVILLLATIGQPSHI